DSAVHNLGDSPVAVPFHFEQPAAAIKRLADQRRQHRLDMVRHRRARGPRPGVGSSRHPVLRLPCRCPLRAGGSPGALLFLPVRAWPGLLRNASIKLMTWGSSRCRGAVTFRPASLAWRNSVTRSVYRSVYRVKSNFSGVEASTSVAANLSSCAVS